MTAGDRDGVDIETPPAPADTDEQLLADRAALIRLANEAFRVGFGPPRTETLQ